MKDMSRATCVNPRCSWIQPDRMGPVRAPKAKQMLSRDASLSGKSLLYKIEAFLEVDFFTEDLSVKRLVLILVCGLSLEM